MPIQITNYDFMYRIDKDSGYRKQGKLSEVGCVVFVCFVFLSFFDILLARARFFLYWLNWISRIDEFDGPVSNHSYDIEN